MGFTKASHLLKHKKEHKQTSSAGLGAGDKEDDRKATVAAGGTGDEEMPLVKREVDSDDDGAPTGDDLLNMSSTSNRPKLRPKKEPSDSDKLHPCKVCNKLLTTAAGLQIHMRRHTGNNLSTCYVRVTCSKQQQQQQQQHIKHCLNIHVQYNIH